MRGLIGVLLAINLAFLGAVLTLPERPRVAAALPRSESELHAERVRVIGAAAPTVVATCVQIADYGVAAHGVLRGWLAQEWLADTAIVLTLTPGWWVHMPVGAAVPPGFDLPKTAFRVRKGPFKGALALANFDTETAACAFRDSVREKGLAAAECGPRPLPMRAELRLPELDDAGLERLRAVLTTNAVSRVECR